MNLFLFFHDEGHGGHLDHALEWFGGMGGTPVREMCPTGCGTYFSVQTCFQLDVI